MKHSFTSSKSGDFRLSPQLALSLLQAHLGARFSDVYVGPGKDARFPTKSDGVAVSELSDASKSLVKQAIAAWTGDAIQGAHYQKL